MTISHKHRSPSYETCVFFRLLEGMTSGMCPLLQAKLPLPGFKRARPADRQGGDAMTVTIFHASLSSVISCLRSHGGRMDVQMTMFHEADFIPYVMSQENFQDTLCRAVFGRAPSC